MALTVEQYLARVRPEELYARLRVADPEALARDVARSTDREGEQRYHGLGHLGGAGAAVVEHAVADALLAAGVMNRAPAILDAGAGSGSFTARVAGHLRQRGLAPRMFAMDASPAMLRALGAKREPIVPFLGVLEDLEGSVREARRVQPLPPLFHGLMSTVALHHGPEPERFLAGAARILQHGAPAVVVDVLEHDAADSREGTGDVRRGFDPQRLAALALGHFAEAEARVLPDLECLDRGKRVGLFALVLRR